jgi:hypothetical protein
MAATYCAAGNFRLGTCKATFLLNRNAVGSTLLYSQSSQFSVQGGERDEAVQVCQQIAAQASIIIDYHPAQARKTTSKILPTFIMARNTMS